MAKSRGNSSANKNVSLEFIPDGKDRFAVHASSSNTRFPFTNNPIGHVVKDGKGGWLRSSWPNNHLGPVFGVMSGTTGYPTKEKAGQELYRFYRSWIGF